MDIGRRDDGLAHRDGVTERARRHLVGIVVRRDVDVGGLEIVEQRILFDEPVDKGDMVDDAQFVGQRNQRMP